MGDWVAAIRIGSCYLSSLNLSKPKIVIIDWYALNFWTTRCHCFRCFSRWKLVYLISVTRWLYSFSIFVHLQQWKWAQWHTQFTKVVSTFCSILNKPSNSHQRHGRFHQSGEISPNLVTLVVMDKGFRCKILYFTPSSEHELTDLVLRLREQAYVQEVVGSNPGTRYWMDSFSQIFL